jgi:hypothetical protein
MKTKEIIVKKSLYIVPLLLLLLTNAFSENGMGYKELTDLVLNNYSQITQLEITGYCCYSIFQQGNNSWQYQKERIKYYGFNNDSAYYINDDGFGKESVQYYLTDKNKILLYYPGISKDNNEMNALYSEYKGIFPPNFACNNLLPFDLFNKKYDFKFKPNSVTVKNIDNLYQIEGITSQDGHGLVSINPEYNFSVIKRRIDLPNTHLEYLYDQYTSVNGIYFPGKATQIVMGTSLETTAIISAYYEDIRINNFQNYELLKNKLKEGEYVQDNRFGSSGFFYQNSTSLSDDSVFQMAEKHNKRISDVEKNKISFSYTYLLYGLIIIFIGMAFYLIQKLLRKK